MEEIPLASQPPSSSQTHTPLLEELGQWMIHPSVIFVDVHSKLINNNNFERFSPYHLTELSNSPYTFPDGKGKPQCSLCYRVFPTYSGLYIHQAKPCVSDNVVDPHPVKVHFPVSRLFFIHDAIKGLGLELKEETTPQEWSSSSSPAPYAGSSFHYSVVVDAAHVAIRLRQFYTAQVTKYNIEQWYPKLVELRGKSTTARTSFLELTDDELNIITSIAKSNLAENLGMERRMTNAELKGQEDLIDRVQSNIEPGHLYFCRLSTRSPKDGVSVSAEDKKLDITSRLKKKLSLLAVSSADQIVNLLTHSQRVFSDINFYFLYRVPGASSAKLNLILRDYIPSLPIDHEFRCYVHNRKMTAISQYQCYCVFPALQNEDHVNACRKAILDFHSSINTAFPMDSYVVDIVVFPDYSCQVIELNPFGIDMASGSALYSWTKDYELLYGNLKEEDINVPIRILKHLTDEENTKGV